jgi:hypothetical protein
MTRFLTPEQEQAANADVASDMLDALARTIGLSEDRGVVSRLHEHLDHLDVGTRANVTDAIGVLLGVFSDPWTHADDPAWMAELDIGFWANASTCQPCRASAKRIEHGQCIVCRETITGYEKHNPLFYCSEECRLIAARANTLRERPS